MKYLYITIEYITNILLLFLKEKERLNIFISLTIKQLLCFLIEYYM